MLLPPPMPLPLKCGIAASGKPADEVMNNYKAKPKFDPAKHMAFKGCEEWA